VYRKARTLPSIAGAPPSVIIDRYIIREILFTLLAVIAILLVIFVSNRFVRYMAELSGGAVDGSVLLAVVGLKTLGAMVIILPLALFMAVLLAFSRLYKDLEMTALMAAGVSTRRIYRPVLLLAGGIAAVVAAISFWLAPWAEERSYQLRDEQQARAEIASAAPGRFVRFSGSQGVFYFRSLERDGGVMREVFVRMRRDGGDELILSAERASASEDAQGERYMVFENGYRYEGRPGSAEFRIVSFREHSVRMEQPEIRPSQRKQKARPTSSLNAAAASDVAELQWRISMPLSVLVLALLAVPLSRTNPRQGKYAKLFVAVLVYLLYNNLLGMANSWTARGAVPGVIGMWWVHLLMLTGAWLLFVRQYGLSWVLSQMRLSGGARP
jgi:lipopolysaccharide export system permease protein